MNTTISVDQGNGTNMASSSYVSGRLKAWFAGDEVDLNRRARRQVAHKAGALAGLAALIADIIDMEKRPCQIAVAKPLTLQPAFFMALASELRYLTETDIALYFSGPQGRAQSWRWAHPRAIRYRLQSFVKGPVKGINSRKCRFDHCHRISC